MGASDASVVRPEGGALEGGAVDGSVVGVDAGADAAVVARTWTVRVGPNGDHVFDPPNLSIRVGDTIHWVWDASNHTVTSGVGGVADERFCSPSGARCATAPVSNSGATYDFTFTVPGTYPYYCRPHRSAGMTGSVSVE